MSLSLLLSWKKLISSMIGVAGEIHSWLRGVIAIIFGRYIGAMEGVGSVVGLGDE